MIVIIGYSLRDPTTGSIFEEIIARRIRQGHVTPFSLNASDDVRINEASIQNFKIIALDSNPDLLKQNLKT